MKLTAKSGAVMAATAAAFLISGAVGTPPAVADSAKVQCFGVNSCKGHGACKTANNACKGQNSCKGKGFLVLTESECMEKGGTTKS